MVICNHIKWTAGELIAVKLFAKRPLSELRVIQGGIEQQTVLAFELDTDNALCRLQRMALIVTAAVELKCFGLIGK